MNGNAETKRVIREVLSEIIEEARGGIKKTVVGLMAAGSELGSDELIQGARLAMENDPSLTVIMIGPKPGNCSDLDWIDTPDCEADISKAMESAIDDGTISGAVALHYPFPLGVATVGKIATPAKGRASFIASSTGTAATERVEAMIRNAIYGIAVAKANGKTSPTVGILNLDGAQMVLRSLKKLQANGYDITFGTSIRKGGGSILRGNDLLAGAVDICVADTLTGNVLMKLFSSWHTGGDYEALGWGYGPSVGEGWQKVVSIISRASGAPVIAGALSYTARSARGGLSSLVAGELAKAKKAGLDELIASLKKKPAAVEDITSPPAEPTEEELHGIDVLVIDDAVKALWKDNIYAESSMGCTGPVIKVSRKNYEKSEKLLKTKGYL